VALSTRNVPNRRAATWSVVFLAITFAVIHAIDLALGGMLSLFGALRVDGLFMALGLLSADPLSLGGWLGLAPVLTYALLHADPTHLGSNLVFFWLFGSLLVKVAGNRWLLATFVFTAITAVVAFAVRHQGDPQAAMIGASGAISGIAGAYVVLAFRWNIEDAYAWPLAHPIPPVQAAIAALLAAALDVYVLSSTGSDGVARDAHIGGFAGGVLLAMVLTTLYSDVTQFRRSWLGGRRQG
jgi:membrane associated rhomboid family serine protease